MRIRIGNEAVTDALSSDSKMPVGTDDRILMMRSASIYSREVGDDDRFDRIPFHDGLSRVDARLFSLTVPARMISQASQLPADEDFIDLRSDTVTRPTAAMMERMISAKIGDDGLDGDPTAAELEATTAALLGKEAGLFVPSCTMANLLATLVHVQRNEQALMEATAHMYNSERGSCTFTGAVYVPIEGRDGAMDLDRLEQALLQKNHALKTGMVAMETTHNGAGGTVLPIPHMKAVYEMATARAVAVHVDGARLFNAAAFLQVAPERLCQYADSVSIALSKGLSAPVGAVLAGSRAFIDQAHRLRRMLGGGQRQVGFMAAAGLEAIQTMTGRLNEEHALARRLSEGLNRLHPFVRASVPQTNIVQVDVSQSGKDGEEWVAALARSGVGVRTIGSHRLRCVTHRHTTENGIDRAIAAFGDNGGNHHGSD